MATLGERVAANEVRLAELATDVRELRNMLEGGGGVEYERSVRGRLHKLESVAAAAVLRRNLGVGLLKGWERAVLLAAALATAAATWYSVLHEPLDSMWAYMHILRP